MFVLIKVMFVLILGDVVKITPVDVGVLFVPKISFVLTTIFPNRTTIQKFCSHSLMFVLISMYFCITLLTSSEPY